MSPLALVVDDSAVIRHTVRHFLEKRGISVQCLQMPRLDGYMLIDALKASEESAGIPVLVLASKPLEHDQPEPRAHSVIYKDLNIEQQLTQALATLFPSLMS